METKDFRGVGPALVTPLQGDGSLDWDALASHVEAQIRGGVDFLVPCGTTGESPTLHFHEQRELIGRVAELAAGRVPVLAGAGTNQTVDATRLAASAREVGADGVLTVAPYYNKPSQEGLYRHYLAVAEAAEIPVVVYNVPGRTGVNVEPATLLRLAEVENVVGVKEASGNLAQIMTILRERPEGFRVLSGDDELTFPILALGGDGVISVLANEVPAATVELVHAALGGDLARALEIHWRLLPLMRANFVQSNPIPVKAALAMMGRMQAVCRLPLTSMDPAHEGALRKALEEAGALGGASTPGGGRPGEGGRPEEGA